MLNYRYRLYDKIILDEYVLGRELFENGLSKISFRELVILGKYLLYEKEFKRQDIRKYIIFACREFDNLFNAESYKDMLDKVMKVVFNGKELYRQLDVPIYQEEIEEIRKLNNFNNEVILLGCLVFIKQKSNSDWFKLYYLSSVIKEMGLKISAENVFKNLFHNSEKYSLTKCSYNKSQKLLFKKSDGNIAFITRLSNLVSDYKRYINIKENEYLYICFDCGKSFVKTKKYKGNRCDDCKRNAELARKRKYWNKTRRE